ncbi:MAG: hypothetical protein AAFV85_23155 [Cyanobacteria bacterium J06634_6]
MEINLSWIVLVAGLAPVVLTAPELSETINHSNVVRQENKAIERARNESMRLANQSKADSQVALERVKSGCIPVVTKTDLKATRLAEGVSVATQDGNDTTFNDGSIICTELRDTAEVWGGKVFQVKRISPEHQEQYDEVYEKL